MLRHGRGSHASPPRNSIPVSLTNCTRTSPFAWRHKLEAGRDREPWIDLDAPSGAADALARAGLKAMRLVLSTA